MTKNGKNCPQNGGTPLFLPSKAVFLEKRLDTWKRHCYNLRKVFNISVTNLTEMSNL